VVKQMSATKMGGLFPLNTFQENCTLYTNILQGRMGFTSDG
jgi:hypothetical protein